MQFFEMKDMNTSLNRNDMDGLVYKKVKGSLILKNQIANFEYIVKQYHKHIRYTMTIKNDENGLRIKVVDTDYQLKKKIYQFE